MAIISSGEAGWVVASCFLVLLVSTPIAGLVYFAARGSGDLWPHLAANVLPNSIRVTITLLIGVGLIVSIVGIGTAWLVATCRFPGRRFLQWALVLPLAVPTYIIAYAYLDVLHPVGPVQSGLRTLFGITDPRDLWFPEIRSMSGCIFVLGFVLYPYVYLPTRALFAMESGAMIEAARSLGAGRTKTFLRVALPLSRPAVAAGASLALLEALNDVGAASFLSVNTLTVSIYTTWLTRSSIEGAAQIALVMLLAVVVLIFLERWGRRRRAYVSGTTMMRPLEQTTLRPFAAFAATTVCIVPILIGFLIPVSYLAYETWRRIDAFGLPADLPVWTWNSIKLSVIATAIAVGLGITLAYTARIARHPAIRAITRLGAVGYAIPGAVLAVGLLVPLAALDNLVDGGMRSLFGVSTGLLITGSGAALVLAYVLRFIAISSGSAEAGFAKIDSALDMSARSLGAGTVTTMTRIHAPLLRTAVLSGALLVFVDCMKELPATLLLRPFDFETLATYIFGEAVRGTYEDGAVAALAIVAVSTVPVIVLSFVSARFGSDLLAPNSVRL